MRVFLAAVLNTKLAIPLLRVTLELGDTDLREACLGFILSHIRSVLEAEQLVTSISTVILDRLKTVLSFEPTRGGHA